MMGPQQGRVATVIALRQVSQTHWQVPPDQVTNQILGQTETTASISCLQREEHFVSGELAPEERFASCGRSFPFTRVTIRDDANREAPNGEVGEICVAGDNVVKGYYKAPEKTAEAIVGGWLHAGDAGYMDADGFLHSTDRKKDMIITGGFNVYSAEVEGVINSHPAVQECAVVGVSDEKWGEAVKAVVERNPAMQVGEEDLIALCRQRLGGVKTPKSVDSVARLPRSAVGKVQKRALRERYWQGAARQVH